MMLNDVLVEAVLLVELRVAIGPLAVVDADLPGLELILEGSPGHLLFLPLRCDELGPYFVLSLLLLG